MWQLQNFSAARAYWPYRLDQSERAELGVSANEKHLGSRLVSELEFLTDPESRFAQNAEPGHPAGLQTHRDV